MKTDNDYLAEYVREQYPEIENSVLAEYVREQYPEIENSVAFIVWKIINQIFDSSTSLFNE